MLLTLHLTDEVRDPARELAELPSVVPTGAMSSTLPPQVFGSLSAVGTEPPTRHLRADLRKWCRQDPKVLPGRPHASCSS